MASPTTRGKYKKQALGEGLNTWGLASGLNGLFDVMDEALHGVNEITLTGTTYTLTSTNYTTNDIRFRQFKFTGNYAATITIPATQNWWIIENQTGQTLTFDNGSNTATLGNDFFGLLVTNGTTVTCLTLPDGVNVATIAPQVTNNNLQTVAAQINNNNLQTVAGKDTEIGRLGTADAVADMNTLGTVDVVNDLNVLGTSANVTAMGHLGTSANVTAMGHLGTAANVTAMGELGTSANVTAMGHLGTSANVTNMANLSPQAVRDDMSALGTSAVRADMAALADTAVLADMDALADTAVLADMDALADTAVLADMNALGAAAVITDMDLLATSANITAMGNLGTSANVTNMAALSPQSVRDDMAALNTTAVLADMAALGDAAVIADMNALGDAAVIADMDLLGTTAMVTAMGHLGTAANVTAMGHLGTAANVTNMSNLGTSANVTNMNTLADIQDGTVATNAITTVASNVTDVTNYSSTYLGPKNSAPTQRNDSSALQSGDLVFRTDLDQMQVRNAANNAWSAVAVTASNFLTVSNNLSDVADAATARTNLGLDALLAAKAPLASPAFTGTPTIGGTTIKAVATSGAYSDLSGTPTSIANLSSGANGSIPYQTGSNTTTFLSIGSTDQVLTVAGGVPVWADASAGGASNGKAYFFGSM